MKLRYIGTPTDLGGTAVSGCGTIHISEIKDTLTKLSDDLEMPFDFNDYILGSTGKREYSGDIDLVVDDAWWGHGLSAFRENLEKVFAKEDIARNGAMLHLKYPIVGFTEGYDAAQPRTGYVQIDFNFGNADWKKLYYYSAGELSAYKGAHRNLMISAICAATAIPGPPLHSEYDTIIEHWDSYDRPVSIMRWKYSDLGFTYVHRTSQKNKNGEWMRKQNDTVVKGPYTDSTSIINALFPLDHTLDDLDSMETLMDAVKRNYGMTDQERIWKRAASNFSDWSQGKLFEYPPEISKYFLSEDK